MRNSIRWTLLGWYALILLLVIGGFGATMYENLHRSMMHEADAALRAHLRTLAANLVSDGQGGVKLALSPQYAEQFASEGKEAGYFAVWDQSHQPIAASPLGRTLEYPEVDRPPHRNPDKPWARERVEISSPAGSIPAGVEQRETSRAASTAQFHEQWLLGPHDTLIVAGRNLADERAKLQRFFHTMLGTGGLALFLALAGGWLLAGRALSPIDKMSRAAAAISADNLSQRIDVAQAKSELGRLAGVLNATFDRLEEAFQRQARFTADASHELRTPLSVLIAHAELALRRERTTDEYREKLDTCLQAAYRLRDVVDGLLTLARADARELVIVQQPVELSALVRETCSMLAPLAAENRIHVEVAAEEIVVPGDRDRLREVITNLLSNAIRYNRPGGRADITLTHDASEVVLTVADTGPGIPAESQPHVFERFYRADEARSRECGGTGLGLAIVQSIITAHRGKITLESEEGTGASFTVRLPLG
jgi:heavy metal sensor kinase